MIQVKGIIFDYGNVLCEPQRHSDLADMALACGLERNILEPSYWRFRDAYDRGDLDAHKYWSSIGEHAGASFTREQIEKAANLDGASWSRPSPAVLSWFKQLKSLGLRTAILSNMPLALKVYIESNCDWLPDFDHRIFSCDVGCIKPDLQIYQHCLSLLQLAPEETLFLDDRSENIETAKILGMHGHLYTTIENAVLELEKQFALPFPLRG